MISEGSILTSKNGDRNFLVGAPLQEGTGGEGQVFHSGDDCSKVIKVFTNLNTPEAHQLQEEKLQYLVKNAPSASIAAWPDALVYENGVFVGYTMPLVNGTISLELFGRESEAANLMPDYSWIKNLLVAKNLSKAVSIIHNAGYVIGDMHPGNIQVHSDGSVTVIDVDSFYFEVEGKCYPCSVGRKFYTAPEYQGRAYKSVHYDTHSDDFLLAILLFMLLMGNNHPFNGKDTILGNASQGCNVVENHIAQGLCPFVRKIDGLEVPIMAPPISSIPENLQKLFCKTFIYTEDTVMLQRENRATADEWNRCLEEVWGQRKSLFVQCIQNPIHFHLKSKQCQFCNPRADIFETIKRSVSNGPWSLEFQGVSETPHGFNPENHILTFRFRIDGPKGKSVRFFVKEHVNGKYEKNGGLVPVVFGGQKNFSDGSVFEISMGKNRVFPLGYTIIQDNDLCGIEFFDESGNTIYDFSYRVPFTWNANLIDVNDTRKNGRIWHGHPLQFKFLLSGRNSHEIPVFYIRFVNGVQQEKNQVKIKHNGKSTFKHGDELVVNWPTVEENHLYSVILYDKHGRELARAEQRIPYRWKVQFQGVCSNTSSFDNSSVQKDHPIAFHYIVSGEPGMSASFSRTTSLNGIISENGDKVPIANGVKRTFADGESFVVYWEKPNQGGKYQVCIFDDENIKISDNSFRVPNGLLKNLLIFLGILGIIAIIIAFVGGL